ncbi:TOBE domain-containing protein, partial [Propylenella binzhouense]
ALAGRPLPPGLAAGRGALLLVRPEQVVLAAPKDALFALTVDETVFRGGAWWVVGRLADGQEVAAELRSHGLSELRPGAVLDCTLTGGWLMAADKAG